MGAEDISNIDVDALLNGPAYEMPMDTPDVDPQQQAAPTPTEPAPTQQQPTQAQPQAFERFTVDGQEIQATKEQLIKWAQMGYSAPNKIGQVKQEYEQKFKPYLEIDEYAKANPDWWNKVQQSFAEREAMAQKLDPNNPLAQEISQLKSQLNEFGQFKNQVLEERIQAQHKQEDSALDAEIKSIREKFADLDWNTANEHGHNLEQQILKFATENGIRKFDAAFKAFTYDTALSRAETRAKESLGKNLQKQVKAGIIGKSPTPTQNLKPRTSFKEVSYEDLLDEAKQEFGINN